MATTVLPRASYLGGQHSQSISGLCSVKSDQQHACLALILIQVLGVKPETIYTDLGYRGVDKDNPEIEIKHRGQDKRLTDEERKLKRRQAIESIIGHIKSDHRMDRCHLKGAEGEALHAVLCAAGYNIRWLLRMIVKKGLGLLLRQLSAVGLLAIWQKLAELSDLKSLQGSDQRGAMV